MRCNTPSAPPHQKYPFMSLIAGKGRASKAVSIVTAALLSLAFPTSGGSNRRLACSLQDIGQGVFEKQCRNHTKLDQTRINRVLGGAARPNRSRQPLASCRSDEHTSELQSLMRNSYAVFCLNNTKTYTTAMSYKFI